MIHIFCLECFSLRWKINRFFFKLFKHCYGVRNNVWKFQVYTIKIVPVAHLKFMHHRIIMSRAFVTRIISDNMLMNLCEIGLFHIVWGVSKGTCDNYHKILWKYCFMFKIYLYIYTFWGIWGGGMYMVHHTFFLYYSKKKNEKYKSMTYT